MPDSASMTATLEWRVSPGLTPYPEAIAEMQARVAAIRAGTAAECVWLVEHPPLYTAGTSARPSELVDPARFPTYEAGRGGQWTYHGPGQRTAYVMLDLTSRHGTVPPRDLRCYVHGLEEWLIRALASLGVRGDRREGRIGVWVATPGARSLQAEPSVKRESRSQTRIAEHERFNLNRSCSEGECKIAAIGVRITRWVSWHGVALNVCPDLNHFAGIVPCGISEYGVTSLRALGVDATLADADAALRLTWPDVFGA